MIYRFMPLNLIKDLDNETKTQPCEGFEKPLSDKKIVRHLEASMMIGIMIINSKPFTESLALKTIMTPWLCKCAGLVSPFRPP